MHVEGGALVAGRSFGDDRHLVLVRSTLERVAQTQQPGRDRAPDRASAEAVHGPLGRSVVRVVVPVGRLPATIRVPDRLLDGHEGSGICKRTTPPIVVSILGVPFRSDSTVRTHPYTSAVASLADLSALLEAERGLAVIATTRADGSVQASVVNVGVLAHPLRGDPVVAFVAQGGSFKLQHLRRDPRVTVVARSGWQWVSVEGRTELAGPDDPLDGLGADAAPQLLRDVFRAAGGDHDDWATYDRVMAEERRVAVLVTPQRVYSN